MLPRCPYEIRDKNEYFDDIQHVKVTKEMLDLAKHVVQTKAGDFAPEKFEDRYEHALVELLNQKRKGEPIRTRGEAPRHGQRRQPDGRAAQEPERRRQARCPRNQQKAGSRTPQPASREMLMTISGKGDGKPAAKETERPIRQRKAG
jgi:DNA end-binding protein Ku